jgi:valyl-tRNA synthetase
MTFENKANLPEKLLKPYNPAEVEESIYKTWEESGFFNPDVCVEKGVTQPDAEHFSIVLPPPNVTGTLHTGHAFMLVIQDIMVRYARMTGKKTLWIPGTDHAAISTQSVVEKNLEKEKIRKQDLGREEFLRRVNEFAQNSHDTIVSQLRKMGASLDWSREAFTLDEKRTNAVHTVFKKMYDDGLIYRGYRIVNWDPKGQTVISDDETDHEERDAQLYTFKYWEDFPISISTTRPETKVGDTAVAVHSDDVRYKEFVGKTYTGIFCGVSLSIKVVADESVEPEFGTGALGVTPAHSQIDWDIAQRHNLEIKPVINEFAKMTVGNEQILGKKTTEAREVIVDYLKSEGLLEKEETVKQNVSIAERSKGIIEPLPKLQWFVDVNKKIAERGNRSLKELMLDAVRKDGISILPSNFEKVYFNWIENLRDWCISRQIWYGHRIPVWYKDDQIFVGPEAPNNDWLQDEDTLDTWFSSGLWTFSTLGWPEETPDFKTYHPTSVLETGNDIIFFWVARMILMSTYILGEIPFKTVYLHGMVLDKNGKKMSKSNPATAIDPLETINTHGADALRMSMIVSVGPGQSTSLSEEKIRAYSKFANKIWNATRFVMEQTHDLDLSTKPEYDPEDQQSISEINAFIKEITKEMDEFKYYLVSEKLYHYFWDTFASNILERSKTKIAESNSISAKWTLYTHLIILIKALHPFMPFITEEIWSLLPKPTSETKQQKLLIIESWPMSD